MERLRAAIEVAHQLNAVVLTFHAGAALGSESRDQLLDRTVDCYTTLSDTSGSDLVVALENMPDRRTSTQNVVVSMKDFVDLLGRSPVMKFTLDIGHALQNDDAAYPGFVARYTPSIAHIHLHEGVAPGAGHLKLGSGQLDLAAFLSLTRDVSHSRSLSLEMLSWPDTAASWQVLMEEWRRLRRKSP